MKALPLLAICVATVSTLTAQTPAPLSPPKLYAVRLTKGPAWDEAKAPNDQAGMREHSANIARLRREGVLVHGARFGEVGLLVLRLPDEAAVAAQLASDPAIAGGVFKVQTDAYAPFAHGTTAWLMTPEAVTLRAYLEAFNRHEADTVAALCAENFRWYSMDGGTASVEIEGRAALREWLAGYFKSLPTVRSEFLSIEQTGSFLSVRERPSWDNKEGRRVSQQALGIYEIRDGLIQRAWYFPSVKDAPPAPAVK